MSGKIMTASPLHLVLLYNLYTTAFSFLNDLPKTEHDMSSFTLDIPLVDPKLMSFTVTGCFRERSTSNLSADQRPLHHFNRMFVVVPRNEGFCIVNEMLHITMATPKQKRVRVEMRLLIMSCKYIKIFFSFKTAFSTAPAAVASPPPAASAASPLNDHTKRAMLEQLAQKTGMNAKFTTECLEMNGFDLEKAYQAFAAAQQQGKIPPEAFQR